mmetsp:Transcript_28771/g.33825  ORF Transcript_28771/g.33825 Transcript_28771/m.33825 type:complete len:148 (+) Transcript_28771:414-857(+)
MYVMKSIWRKEAGIIEELPLRVANKLQKMRTELKPSISKAISRPIYMSRIRRVSPDTISKEEFVVEKTGVQSKMQQIKREKVTQSKIRQRNQHFNVLLYGDLDKRSQSTLGNNHSWKNPIAVGSSVETGGRSSLLRLPNVAKFDSLL